MEKYFEILLSGTDEKASDSEFAKDYGRTLTPEEGLRLQNELLSTVSGNKFQRTIWELNAQAGYDGDEALHRLTSKALMPIHLKVITKFGFPASEKGAVFSSMAFKELNAHPPIAEKSDLVQYLLHPETQKELQANLNKKAPRGISEGRQSNPEPTEWTEEELGKVWVVVGGKDSGGIVVRKEANVSSQQFPQRLGTNATFEQLELKMKGERIKYQKIDGDGPDIGWVSVSLKGNPLVLPYLDFEPPKPKEAKDEVKNFVVVHDRIAQREEPKTDAKMVGGANKGTKFKGLVVSEMGIDWLKIEDAGDKKIKYMLIDGATIGLGVLLEEVKPEKATKWKVVHDRIAQRSEPKKDGGMVGAALKDQEFKGTIVKGDDDVEWLKVTEKGTTKYMMIDGKTVGLGILLEKVG